MIDPETLLHLTHLSRIECTPEELKSLHKDLEQILTYFSQLNEVDTSDVPPCNHVIEGMCNVFRDDEVKDLLPRDLFLSNTKEHVGGMVRIPPVLS